MMPRNIGVDIIANDRASSTFTKVAAASERSGARIAQAGENASRRFGASMIRLGKVAAVGLAAAAGGAALLAKSAISVASDVNEAASKVGVVFGKFQKQVIDQSKTSAAAMGLSARAYLDATGTLGNLLVSLKLGPKRAANMSQQFVKLAGDLASFNNVSPEEALAAIKSGLVGETEPLRAFGVNMNDATLRTQALKLHLIKSVKDGLTPQQKALAASALIMDQTKTAQGDFARTSKGLANQQRILGAEFEDLKGKLGAKLLPVAVKVARFLTGPLANGFSAMQAAFSGEGVTSDGFVGFMERIGVAAKRVVDWIKTHWTEISATIQFVWKLTLTVLTAMWTFLTTKVVPAVKAVVEWVREHWPEIAAAIEGAWTRAQPVIRAFMDLLNTIWTRVLQPLVQWVQDHWPTISKVIGAVLTAVGVLAWALFKSLDLGIKAVSEAFKFIGAGLQWAWDHGLKQTFGAMLAALREIRDLMDSITNNAITKGLNTLGIGKTGDIGGNITLKGFQPRAAGGPVVKGRGYIVGDGGRPELFVPGGSGRIIPNVPAAGKYVHVEHMEVNLRTDPPVSFETAGPTAAKAALAQWGRL